ncbi:MAG: phosphoenolpyruvate carboxylase, partial [bacterium]
IGGDRDGNPNVTPAITSETLTLQVGHGVRALLAKIDSLRQSLSVSARLAGASDALLKSIEVDLANIPEFEDRFKRLNVEEPYRLKATAIRHKLVLTQRRHASKAPHQPGRDYANT